MPKHRVEEITLSAKAHSLESVFSKSAMSLFEIVIDTQQIKPITTKTIILKSESLESLLYLFLKKFYDLANKELFLLAAVRRITIERVSGSYLLDAVVVGDKMNQEYKIKDIIKLITDRNIKIKEERDGTYAQINIIVERRGKDEV